MNIGFGYHKTVACALLILAVMGITLWFWVPIEENIRYLLDIITSRENTKSFIVSCGNAAPLVFILFQILQVLLAPFPGEATGFVGGYLFGAFNGFLFSSIGLTVGSWLNFMIGRFLGNRYIRKRLSKDILNRFERLLKRQGVIILFALFVFPGFPKDYLCLFLGLTTLPFKIFILIAGIGRMPGTLMLSLQGAYVYKQMYGLFALILGASLIMVGVVYCYRERLYLLLEKLNSK